MGGSNIKRAVLLPDIHYPVHSKPCLNAVNQFLTDFQPHILVYMGDQLNLDMVSYWTREKPLLREMQRVMKEYEGFDYEILKVHEELVKAERVWMIGNHEYRVTNYLESHPELIGMLEPEIWLKLEKRKYEVIPFNHAYKLGKLNVIHGWYHNQQHAKKHVFDFERNVVYAHNHTCQEFTKHSPMDVKDFHSATCLPCLCDLNPDYRKNRPNSWIHGFGIVYLLPNGNFNLYKIIIINGKFIWNNKIYGKD